MTEITAPAGFFWDNAVSPTTATDLITAVEAAESNVNNALISEENAAASATAAASSAMSASGSQTAAATSETNAANSATAAAGSVTSANTAASAAAGSATSAATQATIATTQAANSLSSANAAASSATAAANSATNAATSATAAAASATTASNAAATIPGPTVGRKLNFIRVNNSGNAYEVQTAAQVAADIGALNDVGRNKLHNALFNIWQRGTSAFTTLNTYTADRWVVVGSSDTISVSRASLSDSDRTAIADESAVFALQTVFSSAGTAGSFNAIAQRIESVRRLSGKTVTVSFYAKASSGTPKIGVSIDQVFGTGGSPSATVTGNGSAITTSTSWGYYTLQLAIPSASGKTFGSNLDDYTQLNLWMSSGSTNATRAGSIGTQTNTIQVWGVQVEMGTVVTPLEKPDATYDIVNCQRFYQTAQFEFLGYTQSGVGVGGLMLLSIPLRGVPTLTINATSLVNVGSATISASGNAGIVPGATGSASGGFIFGGSFTASADF